MDFSEFVAARRPALVRSVTLMGCPLPEAEDVVQTALLKCYRQWRRIQRAQAPEAYVYRVVVTTLTDARTRRWNGEVPTEELPETSHDVDATTGIAVRRALASMPVPQREVIVLRYYADLSEREIADILRIPPGTVKSRATRGLAALSALLRSPDAH